MEYIRIVNQFFKNDIKNTLTITFYVLVLSVLFFIPQKSYASDFEMSDYIVSANHSKFGREISVSASLDHVYENFQFFVNPSDPIDFNYTVIGCTNNCSSMLYSGYFYEFGIYTIQQCSERGYNILKIPSGNVMEGKYICVPDGHGIDPSNPPVEPDPDPDGILTPVAFDEFFCGRKEIKDKLTYAYYPFEQATDYSVRRSLDANQLSGSGALEIFSCPVTDDNLTGECSHDYMVEQARKYLPNVPSERVHCVESEKGGCVTYDVFAYCKSAIKQISTSDITPDSVDCRKTIYQFTGESGSDLSPLPENQCYEDLNQNHTFKEWCELQFDDSSYWVGANLEEYCDPAEQNTSEEKVEEDDECKITTESIDVGYTTTETSNQIIKDITKKIIVKDCDGNVISEKIVESQIVVDKEEILGDGSDIDQKPCVVGAYCPPNSGTNEGTGSGVGESEVGSGSGSGSVDVNFCKEGETNCDIEAFDPSDSWYTPIYPEGFSGVLNKHIESFNDVGGLGAFFASLNPFKPDGDFPELNLNFDFGIIDFGTIELDLENLPIGENGFNLIALLRMLILINVSIYAFRQVF
ncbi:TPA: hypothetical protein ACN31Q_000453 [Vibrio campbellii]